jgi:hypothetical protein
MAQRSRTVTLARTTVSCRCDVYAFFGCRDEEYDVPPFHEGGSRRRRSGRQYPRGGPSPGADAPLDGNRHRHGKRATHPQVIVGGILREGPFYMPPAKIMRELKGRSVKVQ